MTVTRRLRTRLAGDPDSIGERSRQARWSMFWEAFPDIESLSVLDLGGTVEFWRRAPVRPAAVDIVNLAVAPPSEIGGIRQFEGDACALPSEVADRRYDLVFSNSVIEHVGGHARCLDFASTVRERADRHWIQTPYRYFPIEPHYMFPAAQHLPTQVRAWVARRWPLTHAPGSTVDGAVDDSLWIELLDVTTMRHYFPDSTIVRERLFGLTKSIIAVSG